MFLATKKDSTMNIVLTVKDKIKLIPVSFNKRPPDDEALLVRGRAYHHLIKLLSHV